MNPTILFFPKNDHPVSNTSNNVSKGTLSRASSRGKTEDYKNYVNWFKKLNLMLILIL
jgi:hypothetical protein